MTCGYEQTSDSGYFENDQVVRPLDPESLGQQ